MNRPGTGHILAALLSTMAFAACAQMPVSTAPKVACKAPTPSSAATPAYWYSTLTPSESGNDGARLHLFDRACSAVGLLTPPAVVARMPDLPGLYNAVTRQPGEVFAMGGVYAALDTDALAAAAQAPQGSAPALGAAAGPYVVKLDVQGQKVRWRTYLPGMTASDWNYPGALAVGLNGDLYVTYGHRMARLDPASGVIKAVLELPVNQSASDVTYNGFIALPDGKLVTKSLHRQPGCTVQGAQALLACDTTNVAPSTVVLIDPDRMQVLQTFIAPEHIRFRVSSYVLDGVPRIYLPGDAKIYRYRVDTSAPDGPLVRDDWTASYLQPGQTAGTALAIFDDWVIVQTNGMPTRAPMSVVAINQHDASRQHRMDPFVGAHSDGSFMPSMPTVDPVRRRAFVFDGYVGRLAALDLDPVTGWHQAWQVAQRSFAFSALVGPPTARVLVSTDMGGILPTLTFDVLGWSVANWALSSGNFTREALVWRDAGSGRELGRVLHQAAVATSTLAPAEDGAVLAPDLVGNQLAVFQATRLVP
jgi:hypothetical protein